MVSPSVWRIGSSGRCKDEADASRDIQRKLDQGPKIRAIFESGRKEGEIIEELYLTILSRFPTSDEVKNMESYGQVQVIKQPAVKKDGKSVPQPDKTVVVKRRDDWVDVAWALINSTEFLYRH